MKKLISILALYFIALNSIAQDQLFKKDNSKHEVKITEVTPTEVKYKLKANPDGPLYVIYKSDVALIIYQNGQHETFPDAKVPVQQQLAYTPYSPLARHDSLMAIRKKEELKNYEIVTKTKNAVFVNLTSFINSCVSLSIYREFGKGLFSLHLPFSFSYDIPGLFYSNIGSPNFYNNNYYGISNFRITSKSIDAGIGIYYHTSRKRAITHFIGPLFRFAQYNGKFDVNENNNSNSYNGYYVPPVYKTHGFVMNETYYMINNGILFRITPHFNLMIHAAIGATTSRYFVANNPNIFAKNYGYSYNGVTLYSNPSFHAGFSAGYRF